MIDTKELGKRIRELREQRKMTLRQLAAVAGMHHTYMHRVERGEMSPTIRTLQKIANALGAELNATIGMKSLTLEEVVIIEDETLIKRIISYTKVIKDTNKREEIARLLRETMSTEIVTNVFESQSGWLVLYSLQYDINANSYKLIETKEKEYAPVERKDGYIAVKIEQPLPFSRFDKDDIVIFKKEDKITNPNQTVLIKFDKEKIYLGTYRDFITANPDPDKDTEKYRIAYIIPF